MATTAITPTRKENYSEWYQQIIKEAELADHSDVRGCMVIRPWGFGIWEKIQKDLDFRFKETGHKNAYFPLLIPLNFLQKEAEHVAGFAKECAVVTHRRLVQDEDGKLVPSGKLEEPMIIRPTSETIIGSSFSKWIQSYRDLPVLINQWANVMRWEMRTRLFLRTSEFLWQEGHTAHETSQEAQEESLKMLQVYHEFAHDVLAIPVIKGEKTKGERFPGAVNTYTIEAMMQDSRALQAGTSHFLGQNFSQAQNIKFIGREGKEAFAWTTSWGVSTRLIGGLIMNHSDDNGLVLPPRVAPTQVIVLPLVKNEADLPKIKAFIENLVSEVRSLRWKPETYVQSASEILEERIDIEVDWRDSHGGQKFWKYVKKGVPLIVEIGMRDIEAGNVCVTRRDLLDTSKRQAMPVTSFVNSLCETLSSMQKNLLEKSQKRVLENIHVVNDIKKLWELFPVPKGGETSEQDSGITAGFAYVHLSEAPEVVSELEARKLSFRCFPHLNEKTGLGKSEPGKCLITGQPTQQRVLVAKAY